MPGICGLITQMPRHFAERALQVMLATLCHESFYSMGTWGDESAGVYVGWVARKGSFSDCMPLRNSRGDVVLVFSGEEYACDGRAQRSPSPGEPLERNDAGCLVEACEQDAFPAGLNGWFHGIVIDRVHGTAKLFNDRYGMHRLYYHDAGGAFYFAAEAKAILAVRPELRSLNLQALAEFISCGCVLEGRTLFRGIGVLPPGSSWTLERGNQIHKTKYFQPRDWEEQEPLDAEAYYQTIRESFGGTLPRYFRGSEPIAMSLTGGLDTRIIMAWHKVPAGSLPCYTFGGMINDCWDVRISRQVADICRQPHQVIRVSEDFLQRFPHYAERTVYLSDGCAHVGQSADLYVNEIARQIAPVRMTGNYGGEVLRDLRPFRPSRAMPELYQPEVLSSMEQAVQTYDRLRQTHPLSFTVFQQIPWYHYGLIALEQTQLCLRSPYLDNDLVRTVFRAPKSPTIGNEVCLRLIGEASKDLRQLRTDRGLAGESRTFSAAVLHSFLEVQFKAEYAYDYGMPQWFAPIDRLLSPFHPERVFLGRHKFTHYRLWYRDHLSGFVKEMLLDPMALSRPYVEKKTVEAVVHGHAQGWRQYTRQIHQLLTLELLHRCLLDTRPTSLPDPVGVPVSR